MSHPRQDWTLDRYVQELIYLDELQDTMDPGQAKQLFELMKAEIMFKFPKEEREKQALIF